MKVKAGKMLEAAVRGRSFLPTFSELIASTIAADAPKRPSISDVAHANERLPSKKVVRGTIALFAVFV